LGNFGRFAALTLERKILILFVAVCIVLPFGMARSPLEIFSHSIPLWIYFHGAVSYWFISGKPFWQAYLAVYGISTAEMLGLYFGTFGVRVLLGKGISWLKESLEKGLAVPFSKNQILVLKKKTGYQDFNSFAQDKKKIFAEWLEKQSVWIILLFLFLPFPVTDIIAAIALGTKSKKYGHWYLAAVNVPHILLIVYLLRLGVNFFFF
jgi:hypothetical protein